MLQNAICASVGPTQKNENPARLGHPRRPLAGPRSLLPPRNRGASHIAYFPVQSLAVDSYLALSLCFREPGNRDGYSYSEPVRLTTTPKNKTQNCRRKNEIVVNRRAANVRARVRGCVGGYAGLWREREGKRGRRTLYSRAISGTNGSSGLGSVSREQIDSNTFDIVSAGLHAFFRMSRQIPPDELIFGW